MEVVKFTLSGRLAHFKNPENNYYVEFSYGNIHKPALLGLIGAILGLRGRKQVKELGYIEYYELTKGLEISIVPKKVKFNKFIDESINSTGFANAGSSQILRREFLENPEWDIYLIQGKTELAIWNNIKENLMNGVYEYPINLGGKKNLALIKNVELLEADPPASEQKIINCECKSLILFNDIVEYEGIGVSEYLPIALNELTLYEKKKFLISDGKILMKNNNIYLIDNIYYYFLPSD